MEVAAASWPVASRHTAPTVSGPPVSPIGQPLPLALGHELGRITLFETVDRRMRVRARADEQDLGLIEESHRGRDRMGRARHHRHAARRPVAATHHRRAQLDRPVATQRRAVSGVEQRDGLEHDHRGAHRLDRAAASVERVRGRRERVLEGLVVLRGVLSQLVCVTPRTSVH